MKRWWGTSKREVCRREIRERVRMGERKQRRGMVKKSTDKIDKNWNPRTKYGWESAAARYPKQVVRSRRQGLRQGQRINSPTHLSNMLSRHTHTHFVPSAVRPMAGRWFFVFDVVLQSAPLNCSCCSLLHALLFYPWEWKTNHKKPSSCSSRRPHTQSRSGACEYSMSKQIFNQRSYDSLA